jgi:polysaccharide deacetylase family protein (PEP-CTERM system associated)
MNILTFDIEDWWVYDKYMLGEKEDYIPRLNGYLDKILDLFDHRGIKVTFFCLGEVANNYPEVIRKIASKKHNIGCHSFSHRFLGDATYKEIKNDTHKAIDVIENIIGEKVIAYRAPAFSIMEKNKWIFEILYENGIKYDCSIFPADRSFGGFPSFYHKIPSIVYFNGISIKEFPISTTKILGKDVAYSGGGYFRLFPYWKIKSIVNKSDYVMTYFHIKDFDKEQVKRYNSFHGESSLSRYFKKYYGLNRCFTKFTKFVSDFDFISVRQADDIIDWEKSPKIYI